MDLLSTGNGSSVELDNGDERVCVASDRARSAKLLAMETDTASRAATREARQSPPEGASHQLVYILGQRHLLKRR